MEYNIDILVAGCNTTCMHCYVNGGKFPAMKMEDFSYCIEKLKPVFAYFGVKLNFTLDNEVYNHPQADEILELVEKECATNYYHHGSTTGIAILNHPKKDRIFEILKRNHWLEVSFAIHGGKENHNKLVNNDSGMEAIIAASELFKKAGFQVYVSLMLSKAFCEDLSEVEDLLKEIPYDALLPVIPDFYPIPRLIRYQNIRCNVGDYEKICAFLHKKGVEYKEIADAINSLQEEAVFKRIHESELKKELFSKGMAFFHIDNKLDFYVGNTGAALQKCGNLRDCTSDEIIKWIADSRDNFYETATIHYEDLIAAVQNQELVLSKENYVYPNVIAAVLAMVQNGRKE